MSDTPGFTNHPDERPGRRTGRPRHDRAPAGTRPRNPVPPTAPAREVASRPQGTRPLGPAPS
ncbi:hypothetical protein CTKZ_06440 [Cellulomonas algicola]|uniref:Uncharacterized protein n=1 Tax=Cellulomonas algicola TaxID=2071633 RepID=A0A401UWT7_9CELL|nr:hypothetical protein CTKZ_06440 [Cellulomonas algicola]